MSLTNKGDSIVNIVYVGIVLFVAISTSLVFEEEKARNIMRALN